MDEQTYVEKMENFYILKETRSMLLKKLQETPDNSVLYSIIRDDLNKIEEEMSSYTNGLSQDDLDKDMITSFVVPSIFPHE